MGKRLVYLDVLRAAAILLVIGRHQPPIDPGTWLGGFFAAWLRCGWVGVDLFFCLSGFLIGGLLFDEYRRRKHIDIKRFYIRRGFKIWPSYLLFVCVGFAAHLLAAHPLNGAAVKSFLGWCWPNLLHVQNYLWTPWEHTWSLAVEEHFYLVLPLLFLFLMRNRRDDPFWILPLVLPLVLGACLAMRLATAQGSPFQPFRMMYPTHLRIDSLFAGVVLGYCVHFRPASIQWLRPWRLPLLGIGILCFVPPVMFEATSAPWLYTWGLTLLIFGSLCITAWSWFASTSHKTAPMFWKWVAAMGAYSYSIYLWHNPFGGRLSAALANRIFPLADPRNRLVMMCFFVASSIVLGVVLYTTVEWPMLALRDRLFPSRAARPVPGAAEPTPLPPPVDAAAIAAVESTANP